MKKNLIILIVFGMLSGLMVIESCTKEPRNITIATDYYDYTSNFEAAERSRGFLKIRNSILLTNFNF